MLNQTARAESDRAAAAVAAKPMKDQFGFVCKDGVLRDHTAPLDMIKSDDGTGRQTHGKRVYHVTSALILHVKDHLLHPIEGGVYYKEIDADVFDSANDKAANFGNKRNELKKSPYYIEGLKFLEYYTKGESAVPAAIECERIMVEMRTALDKYNGSVDQILKGVASVTGELRRDAVGFYTVGGLLQRIIDSLLETMRSRSHSDAFAAQEMHTRVVRTEREIRTILLELGKQCAKWARKTKVTHELLEAVVACDVAVHQYQDKTIAYDSQQELDLRSIVDEMAKTFRHDARWHQVAAFVYETHGIKLPHVDDALYWDREGREGDAARTIIQWLALSRILKLMRQRRLDRERACRLIVKCFPAHTVVCFTAVLRCWKSLRQRPTDRERSRHLLATSFRADGGGGTLTETPTATSTALTLMNTTLATVDKYLGTANHSTTLAICESQQKAAESQKKLNHLSMKMEDVAAELSQHVDPDSLRENVDFYISMEAGEEAEIRGNPNLMKEIVHQALPESMEADVRLRILTYEQVDKEADRVIEELKAKVYADATELSGKTLSEQVVVRNTVANQALKGKDDVINQQAEAVTMLSAQLSRVAEERDADRKESVHLRRMVAQLQADAAREKTAADTAVQMQLQGTDVRDMDHNEIRQLSTEICTTLACQIQHDPEINAAVRGLVIGGEMKDFDKRRQETGQKLTELEKLGKIKMTRPETNAEKVMQALENGELLTLVEARHAWFHPKHGYVFGLIFEYGGSEVYVSSVPLTLLQGKEIYRAQVDSALLVWKEREHAQRAEEERKLVEQRERDEAVAKKHHARWEATAHERHLRFLAEEKERVDRLATSRRIDDYGVKQYLEKHECEIQRHLRYDLLGKSPRLNVLQGPIINRKRSYVQAWQIEEAYFDLFVEHCTHGNIVLTLPLSDFRETQFHELTQTVARDSLDEMRTSGEVRWRAMDQPGKFLRCPSRYSKKAKQQGPAVNKGPTAPKATTDEGSSSNPITSDAIDHLNKKVRVE